MTKCYVILEKKQKNPLMCINQLNESLYNRSDEYINSGELPSKIHIINDAIEKKERVILFLPYSFVDNKKIQVQTQINSYTDNPTIYFYNCPRNDVQIKQIWQAIPTVDASYDTTPFLKHRFFLKIIYDYDMPSIVRLATKNETPQNCKFDNEKHYVESKPCEGEILEKEIFKQNKRSKLFYLFLFLCGIGIVSEVIYSVLYRSNFNWKIAVGIFSFIVLMAVASVIIYLREKTKIKPNLDQNNHVQINQQKIKETEEDCIIQKYQKGVDVNDSIRINTRQNDKKNIEIMQ